LLCGDHRAGALDLEAKLLEVDQVGLERVANIVVWPADTLVEMPPSRFDHARVDRLVEVTAIREV